MAFSTISAVITLASTAVGMAQANAQRQQQEQAQRRSAAVAAYQAQAREEEARAERRQAHDQAQRQRLAAAGEAASLRARMAASGAQADQGSPLDTLMDTAERGELDALSTEQQGERAAHTQQMNAWSLHNQADALRSRARATAAGGTATQLTLMGQGLKTGMGYMQSLRAGGRLIA